MNSDDAMAHPRSVHAYCVQMVEELATMLEVTGGDHGLASRLRAAIDNAPLDVTRLHAPGARDLSTTD